MHYERNGIGGGDNRYPPHMDYKGFKEDDWNEVTFSQTFVETGYDKGAGRGDVKHIIITDAKVHSHVN